MTMKYNSNLYKFGKNFECFRNDQCWSGYCSKGRCSDPERIHDPCRPDARNCPKPLNCSEYSRTCTINEQLYLLKGTCYNLSDCRFNEYCVDGKCIPNRPIGSTCISVSPDLCTMGSKCTVSHSLSETTKCYELCSNKVGCPYGYLCMKNVWNADPICVQKTSSNSPELSKIDIDEIFYGGVLVITGIILLLLMIYGWIKFTNRDSGNDPRFKSTSNGKKKKKVRLCYTGNGLATITVIPSNCQSPRPVAASELFPAGNPYNINITYPDSPPEYSEAILIR